MSDDDTTAATTTDPDAAAPRPRRARTRKTAQPTGSAADTAPAVPATDSTETAGDDTGDTPAAAAPKRRRTAKKSTPATGTPASGGEDDQALLVTDSGAVGTAESSDAAEPAPRRRRAAKKAAAAEPAAGVEAPRRAVDTDDEVSRALESVQESVQEPAQEPVQESAQEPVLVEELEPTEELQSGEQPSLEVTDAPLLRTPTTAGSIPAEVGAPRSAPVTSAEPIRMKPLTPEALLAAVERGRQRAAAAAETGAPPATVAAGPAPFPTATDRDLQSVPPAAEAPPADGAPATSTRTLRAEPEPESAGAPDPRFRRRGEPGYGEDRTSRPGRDDRPADRGAEPDAAGLDAAPDDPDAAPARRPALAPLFVDADEQPRGSRRRSRSRGGEHAAADTGADGRRPDADTTRGGPDALLERLVAHAPGDPDEVGTSGTGPDETDDNGTDESGARRKRRRRGGRGRRRVADDDTEEATGTGAGTAAEHDDDQGSTRVDNGPEVDDARNETGTRAGTDAGTDGDTATGGVQDSGDDEDQTSEGGTRRRRRRRRRGGEGGDEADGGEETASDEAVQTTVRVREPRRRRTREGHEDEVTPSRGSTRLEAKKIRRKEGRDANKRRPPILSEAEFLARRESVGRTMLVRESDGRTQIAVLEDDILVEHYIAENASNSERSMIGDVYLGRVQNVLPAMEAAFIDIGHGRNGVLYAGEVNWDGAGLDGKPKRIELALKSGQPVLVQVTKDPIGHKGARLTAQISLAGRYLVYVPNGSMSGISRKLPDTERARLKKILKELIPSDAGVIVRTAAEGATEAELTGDVERLKEQWAAISKKAKGSAPNLLQGEPDLAVKVVRDIFNSDFTRLVVTGDAVRDEVVSYVGSVAPTLVDRVETWSGDGDLFAEHRIDEQLAKALERKVFLPSGGSLVIDRTEAMTVVDVNTGRFTGSGGNLEETVTENNLEAAEELVRQLRLRDIGGIIVVDFIDMVFEANRELVIRRLVECLGRDRTKHQVAEVSSLGLVQMTRKRIGRGLLEVFGHPCELCKGRGVVVDLDGLHPHDAPESHPVPGRVPNPGNTGRLHSAKVAAGVVPATGEGPEEPDVHATSAAPESTTDQVDRTTDELDGGVADPGAPVEPESELVVAGHPS